MDQPLLQLPIYRCFLINFLRKAIIDHGITDIINKFLGKLDYKPIHILHVIGELDTYKNPIL